MPAPTSPVVDKGRSFERGRDAFVAGQCIKCHRMGDAGGGAGPDLTAISSRFGRKDILEAILDPSKVISEQFQNVTVATNAGKVVTGRLVDETAGKIVIQPDPLSGDPGRICVSGDELNQRVYCSCRCRAPEGDPGPLCDCPDRFSCVDVVDDGPPGLRGGYCVRNGTFTD